MVQVRRICAVAGSFRFEIQDARLKAKIAASGEDRELSDLDDSPETLVTSLAELTDISADKLRDHVVAAVVAKTQEIPTAAAAAVIGLAPRHKAYGS